MGSSFTFRNVNKSFPIKLSRTIAITVGSGLFLITTLFAAISVLSLLGFSSTEKVLENLSQNDFPQTTQQAQLSIVFNQLQQDTDALLETKTQAERQLTFKQITTHYKKIDDISTAPLLASGIIDTETTKQKKMFEELNAFVSKRIDLETQVAEEQVKLSQLLRNNSLTSEHLHQTLLETNDKQHFAAFYSQANTLIYRILHTSHGIELFEIEQDFSWAMKEAKQLQGKIPKLPIGSQQAAEKLLDNVGATIVQKDILNDLLQQKSLVIETSTSIATTVKKRIDSSSETFIKTFSALTNSVTQQTEELSQKLERQITLLSILFFLSLLLATVFYLYFRSVLIARLTKINKTVLAMVAGQKVQVEESGNDEISEIARSINYFSEELHEAKSIAETSAIQKAEFLAHMSHEIRTPMNAILGFSDLALKTDSPEEHLDSLSKINRASHSLLGIINSVLDLSKIEAGKFTIEKESFDLREVLEDLATIVSLQSEESGVPFYFSIDPKCPYNLIGDPLRLSQILSNLITNGFKFTGEGYIALHITLENEDKDNKNYQTFVFSVQDTGSGIEPGQEQDLFLPFNQGDHSITRKFGGTGLGLAICKNLVEMMGGKIWLEEGEGSGTTFSFAIPLLLQSETESSLYERPVGLDSKGCIVMSSTPKSATELSVQLTNFGLQVFQTLSLDEVLTFLQQDPSPFKSELLFLDCEDTTADWREAIKAIRLACSTESELAIIAMGQQRLATHFLSQTKQDYDSFLVKPITPARLLEAMLTALNQENPFSLQSEKKNNPGTTQPQANLGGAHVMLVEDNEINAQIAIAYLKSMNLSVTTVTDGAQAVQTLASGANGVFDLILMDIQMPIMDGYTATKKIRKLPGSVAQTPIMALTAHAMQDEREKCFAAGMNGYITKPINPIDLSRTLSEFINFPTITKAKVPDTTNYFKAPLAINSSLNMKVGLSRVMHKPSLYMDLLLGFVKKYRGYPAKMKESLLQNEFENSRRSNHTLKGVSGSLGMEKLYALTRSYEVSIKKQDTQSCMNLVQQIIEESENICSFLVEWLDRNKKSGWNRDAPPNSQAITVEDIETLVVRLDKSLSQNSSKALKQASQLKSQLEQEDALLFSRIEQYINDLEYKRAHALLLEWKNKHKA